MMMSKHTARLILWCVFWGFGSVILEFFVERGIKAQDDQHEQHALRSYQWLVARTLNPMVYRTVVVEIDPAKEFSTASVSNLCGEKGERVFLTHLLKRIASGNPAVIVVDKSFGLTRCSPDGNDPGSQQLIKTVREIRATGLPVIVGLDSDPFPTEKATPSLWTSMDLDDGDCIAQSLTFSQVGPNDAFDDQEGLINVARDNRRLALRFRGLLRSQPPGICNKVVDSVETLALVAARKAYPNLTKKDKRLTPLIDNWGEPPFIGFSGAAQWMLADQHLYASQILCGQNHPIPSSWLQCLAPANSDSKLKANILKLAHQVVIIGETTDDDYHFTAAGRVQGFYLQANYIEALLDSQFLTPTAPFRGYFVGFVFLASFRSFLDLILHHEHISSTAMIEVKSGGWRASISIRAWWFWLSISLFLSMLMPLVIYVEVVSFKAYIDPIPVTVSFGLVTSVEVLHLVHAKILEYMSGSYGPAGEIATKLAAVAQGETVTLPGERKEITLDSKVLSRYVGVYRMPGGLGGGVGPSMVVALDGNQLTSKLANQQALPIFPQSETIFFLKVVDAQIEFPKDDGSGRASQLTLHQNGMNMTGKRMDDAEAKRITDATAAFDKRLKEQTSAAGSVETANKMIRDLFNGKPDESMLNPGAPIHQQLARLQSEVAAFGSIEKISFQGVGPGGADIYVVKSANRAWEFRIWLTADGKVEQANTRPVQ